MLRRMVTWCAVIAAVVTSASCVSAAPKVILDGGRAEGDAGETDGGPVEGDAGEPVDGGAKRDAGAIVCGGADGADGADGGPDSDQAQSGSRIKIRWAISPEGAKKVVAFRDAQLAGDCFFYRAADGAFRCLPVNGMTPSYPGQYPHRFYADAACAQPVVIMPFPGSLYSNDLAEIADTTGCVQRIRVFQVGAEVHPTKIYQRSNSGCRPASWKPSGGVFPVGAEVDPSRYVRADVVTARGSGVLQTTLHADDGLVAPHTLYDKGNEDDCVPGIRGGATRCLPRHYEIVDDYSDSNCAQEAYWVSDATACSPPRFASSAWTAFQQCADPIITLTGSTSTVYEHLPPTMTCALRDDPPGVIGFTSSGVADDCTFPAAKVSLVGQGRIKRRVFTWPGGLLQPYDFFDSQLGEACFRWTLSGAADGTAPCAPCSVDVEVSNYFADPGCSRPLAGQSSDCSAPARYLCTYGYAWRPRSFALGSIHTGPVYSGSPASCGEVSSPSSPLYEIGAEVPTSAMAQMTIKTD